MKNTIKISSVLFLFFLLACEKTIDLVDPNVKEQAVVFAVLQPDSTMEITLYKSNDPLKSEDEYDLITDAQVSLFEGTNKIDFSFSGGNKIINREIQGKYYSSEIAKENTNYSLQITHPDYKDITASTLSLSILDFGNISTQNLVDGEVEIVFDINDNASEENYYNIQVFEIGYDTVKVIGPGVNQIDVYGPFPQEVYFNTGEEEGTLDLFGDSYSSGSIIDDEFFNGQTKTLRYKYYGGSYSYIDQYDGYTYTTIRSLEKSTLVIESLNKEYYEYLISYNKQINSEGNPFAEPVIVRSNIANGVGILGSKSTFIKEF